MTPRAKLSVVSGPFVTATANTEFAPQRTSSVKVSPLSSTWVSLLRISSAFQPASGLPGVVHGSFCASRPLPSSFAALRVGQPRVGLAQQRHDPAVADAALQREDRAGAARERRRRVPLGLRVFLDGRALARVLHATSISAPGPRGNYAGLAAAGWGGG